MNGEFQQQWWCEAKPDQDMYEFFVIQYYKEDDKIVEQQYLYDKQWINYQNFEIIRPALSLDGKFVHALAGTRMLDRKWIAEAIQDKCIEIVTNIIMQTTRANTLSDHPSADSADDSSAQ